VGRAGEGLGWARKSPGERNPSVEPSCVSVLGRGMQQGAHCARPGIMVKELRHPRCRRDGPCPCQVAWTPSGNRPGKLSQISPTQQSFPSLSFHKHLDLKECRGASGISCLTHLHVLPQLVFLRSTNGKWRNPL